MSLTKVSAFICLILVLNLCAATPADRHEKVQPDELARIFVSGFNSAYQIARFLIHGENLKENPQL